MSPSSAPSWISLGAHETLVLTAAASTGARLLARLDGRDVARSLPLDGVQGSLALDPAALRPRRTFARLELYAEHVDGERVSIGATALVEPRARSLARACAALAASCPLVVALLSAIPSATPSAPDLVHRVFDAALCAAPLLLGLRVWAGRLRWVLTLHAPSALLALVCAWGLALSIRAERVVIHNLSGAPQAGVAIPRGASAWTRAGLARTVLDRPCAPHGPVCLQDDPRALVPAGCGAVPPLDPLASLDHRVRYLGCPDRFTVVPASVLNDRAPCVLGTRGEACCLDLRGPSCAPPRSVSLELPWSPARPTPPPAPSAMGCPARGLTSWRVTVAGARDVAAHVNRVVDTMPGRALCVDLERWGAAHEIIIEDGASTWRAVRPRSERPSAMRVVLPALDRPASIRVAFALREGDGPTIDGVETLPSLALLEGGWLRPAAVRFTVPSRAGARATLSAITLGPRAADRPPRWEVFVGEGSPTLHAELWPGIRCGEALHVRDARGPLGRATLPCAAPGTREDLAQPWVLWRFGLRPSMPAPWLRAASVLRARPDAPEPVFAADGAPREVFVAFRGWDGVSVDLRLFTSEPRTLGMAPAGDGRYELFAGPPPPRPSVCCQLDGIWSPCPPEFNDYWRCQGRVAGRPGCGEAYARCTFIDWAAERAAGHAPPRRR